MKRRRLKLWKPLPDQANATFGERMADHVAAFGGSWAFIFSALAFLAAWVVVLGYCLRFDPFPFILLNLVLSMLAALQAPIIMMSQNRQETRDRTRNDIHFQITQGIASAIERIFRAVSMAIRWGHAIGTKVHRVERSQAEVMDLIRDLEARIQETSLGIKSLQHDMQALLEAFKVLNEA